MADVVIVLMLAGAFLLGFFQGVIRGLLAIAVWLLAFIVGANLASPVGRWLSGQWTHFTPAYNEMLAFGTVALVVFVGGSIAIQVGSRGSVALSRYPLLDDVLGGLLAVALALLVLAATVVVLDTFHAVAPVIGMAQTEEWTADLHRALQTSTIARLMGDSLVPGLGAVLDPLLPQNVSDVMR